MSTIKIIFIFLFLNCFCLSFSQAMKKRSDIVVYLDLKNKALREYTIDKDTMSAHFSIYIKKYECKKERDKASEIYNKRIKNRRTSGENPSEVSLPIFSIGLYVFNQKPEKLKSLKGIKFTSIKQFQDSIDFATNPTYVIHKLKDGSYLKWKTTPMD
ncbi:MULTISPECIES: hypothetical protein [unclassified Flavobacterium]|uniref:hypothetical protein n=1 Tax=unclassified Flavobacterium TaxID=196869 RepID=UPI0004933A1D|nr:MULTISPECIES: hypothetical protein [unclassified Flavobacterium]MBF4494745.1 hypothetical protein [Flavobacterium sp. MR2016-29]